MNNVIFFAICSLDSRECSHSKSARVIKQLRGSAKRCALSCYGRSIAQDQVLAEISEEETTVVFLVDTIQRYPDGWKVQSLDEGVCGQLPTTLRRCITHCVCVSPDAQPSRVVSALINTFEPQTPSNQRGRKGKSGSGQRRSKATVKRRFHHHRDFALD